MSLRSAAGNFRTTLLIFRRRGRVTKFLRRKDIGMGKDQYVVAHLAVEALRNSEAEYDLPRAGALYRSLPWSEPIVCMGVTSNPNRKASCLAKVDVFNCVMWPPDAHGVRCLLASHEPLFGAHNSFQQLVMRRHGNLPDPRMLLAAPAKCFNFARVSKLKRHVTHLSLFAPHASEGTAMRTRFFESRRYPWNASDDSWRVVILDNGGCLELMRLGIPQHVQQVQRGLHVNLPLMEAADYEALLPPQSMPAARALYRASYPDVRLLEIMRKESETLGIDHRSLPAALRRPAIVVSTPRRFSKTKEELWNAGFEATMVPAVYDNKSVCFPGEFATNASMRYAIALANALIAWHNATGLLLALNVPHALFEDDAVRASSVVQLHRYMDEMSEHDVVPLGGCGDKRSNRWSCGHANFVSLRAARLMFDRAEKLKHLYQAESVFAGKAPVGMVYSGTVQCRMLHYAIDVIAHKWLCKKENRLRCSDWRHLMTVHNERYNQSDLQFAAGWGYFVQDRREARLGRNVDGMAALCSKAGSGC